MILQLHGIFSSSWSACRIIWPQRGATGRNSR